MIKIIFMDCSIKMKTKKRLFILVCGFISSFSALSDDYSQTNIIPAEKLRTFESTAVYSDSGDIDAKASDPEAPLAADLLPAPNEKKLTYGEGVDTTLGKSTGHICVSFENKSDPKEEKNVSTKRRFEFVGDQSLVSDYSSISLGTAFPVGGIPVDLSFGNKSASYKSRFASHIIVESTAFTKYSSKKNDGPQLSKMGVTILKKGYSTFRLLCGDEFVIGKSYGGYLYGIFSFEATSMSSQRSMEASLKVGANEAKGNGSLSQSSESAFSNVTDRESLTIIGTKTSPHSSKLADVYPYYRDFSKTIFDGGDSRELFYETVDYLPLILKAKSDISGSANLDPELAKAMSRLRELIQYRSDVLYASKNWIDFLPISNAYTMTLIVKIDKEIESIRTWGIRCLSKTFQLESSSEASCGILEKEVPPTTLLPIVPSNRPSIAMPRAVFASPCGSFVNIAPQSQIVRILRISGNFVCHRWNCVEPADQNMEIKIRDATGGAITRRYIGPTKIPANHFADAHTTDCQGDWWTDNEAGDAVYDLAPAMFPDDPFTSYD